jgi:hypothetical protein
MTVAPDELAERRAAAQVGDDDPETTEEPTGVVESDLAEDTPEETEPEAEPKPTPPMQIAIPGDWSGIGTEFGGRNPDSSEIRCSAGKCRSRVRSRRGPSSTCTSGSR